MLRYAERQALSTNEDSSSAAGEPSGGFSVVPKELRLKIVGIVETEPAAGYGGIGNARLLMPLATASTLRAAQVNDLRDIVRDNSTNKTTYPSLSVRAKSPSQVEALEASIKAMGFGAFSLLDASKSLQTFFKVFDSLLGIFGSLAPAVATLGIVNTLVMAILERRREIGVLKALGAADSDVQQLFFRRSRRDGIVRWIPWSVFWLVTGPRDYHWHQHLFEATEPESYRAFLRAVVAGDCSHPVRDSCQPGGGTLSCFACGQAQSG